MPIKLIIEPHRIARRGQPRWRVIIPIALRKIHGGIQRRLFSDPATANRFCRDLVESRDGSIAAFGVLPGSVQESILRAVKTMGDSANRIDEAATAFVHRQNNQPSKVAKVKDVIAACLLSKAGAGCRKRSLRRVTPERAVEFWNINPNKTKPDKGNRK